MSSISIKLVKKYTSDKYQKQMSATNSLISDRTSLNPFSIFPLFLTTCIETDLSSLLRQCV